MSINFDYHKVELNWGGQPLTLTLTASSFDPGPLRPYTTYYWQVTVSDGRSQVSGPVWSFTTLPQRIYFPIIRRP